MAKIDRPTEEIVVGEFWGFGEEWERERVLENLVCIHVQHACIYIHVNQFGIIAIPNLSSTTILTNIENPKMPLTTTLFIIGNPVMQFNGYESDSACQSEWILAQPQSKLINHNYMCLFLITGMHVFFFFEKPQGCMLIV